MLDAGLHFVHNLQKKTKKPNKQKKTRKKNLEKMSPPPGDKKNVDPGGCYALH